MVTATYISLSLFDTVAEAISLPECDRRTQHGRFKVLREVERAQKKERAGMYVFKTKSNVIQEKKRMLHP